MNQIEPLTVTERETSKLMAVSVAALRRWRREHRGPPFLKIGRMVRYRRQDIEEFLADCTVSQGARRS